MLIERCVMSDCAAARRGVTASVAPRSSLDDVMRVFARLAAELPRIERRMSLNE